MFESVAFSEQASHKDSPEARVMRRLNPPTGSHSLQSAGCPDAHFLQDLIQVADGH